MWLFSWLWRGRFASGGTVPPPPAPDVAFFRPQRAPKPNPEFRARQRATEQQVVEWRRKSLQQMQRSDPPPELKPVTPVTPARIAFLASLADLVDEE